MEQERAQKIFEAIKKDDLKLFSSLLTSPQDFQICYGRFPLLSICYLFESYKILSVYENRLLSVNRFEKIYEPFEIYKKFKQKAKRCLRFYVNDEKIVYPIEMLAILNEQRLIKDNYKKLFKNEEILNNIIKIYNFNHKTKVIAEFTKIDIQNKKQSKTQKLLICFVSLILFVSSLFSGFSLAFVGINSGLGTKSSPITISTEEEFVSALESGKKNFVLDSDITINKELNVENFSGVIDGDGHTIELEYDFNDEIITNLSGTIKNIAIIIQDINKEISQNFAILTENNGGNIENVQIYCSELNIESNSEKDVYVSIFSNLNSGSIVNSTANIPSLSVTNKVSTNCYYSAFAGVNNGTISNCITGAGDGTFDTVDAGGIVAINNGEVSLSTNNMNLLQTSSSNEWNPNTAGVVLTNNNLISKCINNGDVSSVSTADTVIEDTISFVFAGGIVCDNAGTVSHSRNFGDISASGNISYSYAGGIATIGGGVVYIGGYIYTISERENSTFGLVEYSKSKGTISASSTNSEAYSGGVVAFNVGGIDHSGFEGNIEISSDTLAFAGGIAGFNVMINSYYYMNNYIKNSYANAMFTRKGSLENVYVASVVGRIITNMNFSNNHYVQNSSFSCPVIATFGEGDQMSVNETMTDDDCGSTGHTSLEDISSEVLLDDEIE